MVHRIKEELGIGESKYVLSTQEFADGTKEEGYRYLTEFSFETLPVWNYLISGVEMEKEIVMAQGSNQIALNYHLKNRSQEEAVLCVTPFFQFEPKGEDLKEDKIFSRQDQKITDGKYNLFFETNGKVEGFQEKKSASLLFAASRASVLASTASVRSLSGVGAVDVVEPGFVPVVVLAMSSKLRSNFVWTPST